MIAIICASIGGSANGADYAWWPLNDGTGATAQNLVAGGAAGDIVDHDVAGLGQDGSVWVNDPERGTVLGLNGTTGWVDAGTIPQMTIDNKFSWSFWAKQASGQAVNNDIVIGNRYGADGADTFPREFVKFTPTQFEYHMDGGGAPNIPYDPPVNDAVDDDIPSNDEWIHHAVVKQGDSLVYFRDGQVANSGTIPTGMGSPDPLPFALGGQDGRETWRGYLSDVQLYESALDANGIATAMGGNVAAGDLYARWLLNDGDGETADDSGPNNLDGEIFDWDLGGLADDGSVWADDPDRGKVLGLAGDTAWVAAGELPIMDLENNFTWSFWAKQDADQDSPNNDIVIGNRYDEFGDDTVPREFIKFTPNRFEFHMEGAGAGDLQYAGADGPWIHHVVVKDGEDVTYYRDGEEAGEGFVSTDQLSEDELPFAMGGQDGVETWAGFLSEVRLFDHALNDAEISELSTGVIQVNGDFNNNGELDVEDIDLLTAASASLANDAAFDLTGDGKVDGTDVSNWIKDLKNSWSGDSNLDGQFNSSDFVAVFGAGLFEKDEAAVWSQGDWNGDGFFNSSDFVAAFTDGGYEQGLRPPAAVPEPTSIVLLVLAVLGLSSVTRNRGV